MRKDKEKAIELRRLGWSYKQIRTELGIPIATLSDWFRRESWSYEIKNKLTSETSLTNPEKIKLMVAATKERYRKTHQLWREEATAEFMTLKSNHLFTAGLMLYWGEGDKQLKNSNVSLSNSDPEMIRIFNSFLIAICGVPKEKIRLSLILYPDLVDSVQKNLWSKLTDMPTSNFTKSSVIRGRHPTKRNSYGVCVIRTSNIRLKEKVLTWIKLCQKDFRTII